MLKKGFYFIFMFCMISVVALAQPGDDKPIVEGDDGAKEAALRAQYLTDFHNYNAQLNSKLGTKNMYHHHIDVNRTSASIPQVGQVTQAIDCYFVLKDNAFVIKKILVLTRNGAVSSTKEFVYDYNNTGSLSYYSYNSNIADENSNRIGVYFDRQQLIYYGEDGLVQPQNSYDDEVFKTGIEILNLSADYELMLNTIIRVHPR